MTKAIDNDPRRRFLATSAGAGLAVGLLAGGFGTAVRTARAQQAPEHAMFPTRQPRQRQAGALPPLAFRVYHKLGFGPRPDNPANPNALGDIEYFNNLGANDAARLQAWLDEQIAGGADPEVDSRTFQNPNFTTLDKSLELLWQDYHRFDGDSAYRVRRRPFRETQLLAITRLVHSRWQLREVLADFWHNHFNVDGNEDAVRSVMVHHDRDVIRPHIFGNFRAMLEAAVKSTAMMYYLDNRQNATPNPNENYARELLELHTLGAVENYFGFTPPEQVPANTDGQPTGYVEADVLEMARLLTGFGVADGDDDAPDTGEFLFRPGWHDFGNKTVVGLTVPGTGESELDVMLDYLTAHRGTAEFICWKLAVRLIGDGFSADSPLIQQAADIFQSNWQAADQLERVYRFLIGSAEFTSIWGDKTKRPMEIIASALRAAGVDFTFEMRSAADDAGEFGFTFDIARAGQEPFAYEPPTGYPEDRAIWEGTGPLIMSWRAVSRMLRDTDWSGGSQFADVAGVTNDAGVALTPTALVDFWAGRMLGSAFALDAAKRNVMIAFVQTHGQASGPDAVLGVDTDNTSDNSPYQRVVRGLVLQLALLPDVMVR
jgi:uncharacterized protein (DUF1800 family)